MAQQPQQALTQLEGEYLTIDQLSDILGKHRGTLARYRVEGKGPRYRKLGRTILYRRSDVLAWIDGHTYSCTAEYDSASGQKMGT